MLQNVIALDPDKAAHKLMLAALYWETGKEDKARELLGQVISADKKNEDGVLQVFAFYVMKKGTRMRNRRSPRECRRTRRAAD